MRGSIIIAALAVLTASCQNECPSDLEDCGGGGYLLCVDLQADHENCGACDNVCPSGHVCEEGVCTLSCPEWQADCDGVCRDLMTDRYNCGWCGLECRTDFTCIDGMCEPSDPP